MGEPRDACFEQKSPYDIWTTTTTTSSTTTSSPDFFIIPNSGAPCPTISFNIDQMNGRHQN